MKHIGLCLVLLAMIAGGCKQVRELLRFNVNFTQDFTIPKGGVPGASVNIGSEVPVDENTFKNKGTALALVEEIRINKIKLTIIEPSGQTFRFLETINIFISKADGTDEQKIAFKDPVSPDIANVLELDTDQGPVLDDYFKANKFKFRIEAKLRRAVEANLKVRADFTFSVIADPL